MNKPIRIFNRNFFLLWQGQLISLIGTEGFKIATIFWIKHATGSGTIMGLLLMVSHLPMIFFAPIGGTFADLYSRKKIIVFTDLFKGITILSLACLMYLNKFNLDLGWNNIFFSTYSTLFWIFIAAFLTNIFDSFFQPSVLASIPKLVPNNKLILANSIYQLSSYISAFIGQGLGGVLFRILGAPMLYLIDGITYIISAFSELFINIPQHIQKTKKIDWKNTCADIIDNIKDGYYYVWKNDGLRNFLLIIAIQNFFVTPFILLLPFYVENILCVTEDWYGYFIAALSCGVMFGFMLASYSGLTEKKRKNLVIFFFNAIGIIIILFGLVRNTLIALVIILLLGMFAGFIQITIISIIQATTPSEYRGRVFGFFETIKGFLIPVAFGISGIFIDILSEKFFYIYYLYGGAITLFSLFLPFNKAFCTLLQHKIYKKEV